jgi:hypothetical protein
MGLDDEHWCTVCKKSLNKRRDEYTEFEQINPKGGGKTRGCICKACQEANPALKDAIATMRQAGNPTFTPVVECLVWKVCATYEPIVDRPVRCRHIAVDLDKLYCKRAHPGELELTVEETQIERITDQLLGRRMKEVLEGDALQRAGLDPLMALGVKAVMGPQAKQRLEQLHVSPTNVVSSNLVAGESPLFDGDMDGGDEEEDDADTKAQ